MSYHRRPSRGRLADRRRVARRPRDDFASPSPANLAEVVGTFPNATPQEVDAGGRRRPGRVPRLAADQPHPPRRVLRPPRAAHQARHRRPRRAHGPRVRQDRHRVPGRGGRRAAHGAVRLRHRPDAVRRRARLRDRREGRLHAPQAVGRGRGHHAVELPVRGAAVDARAVPARRATRRVFKPSRGHARRSASGWSSCSSRPASRRARSTSSTATARSARRWCKNPGVNVVLFTGSYEVGKRIQELSAELARPHRRRRDGQQERRHRLRGRPARPGGDRRRSSARSRRPASAASRRAASSSTSR